MNRDPWGDAGDDRDPAMTRLLARWGESARAKGSALFTAPADLPRLRSAMDAVDADLAAGRAPRARRLFAAAAAATFLLTTAAWFALRDGDTPPAPALRALDAVIVVAPGGVARSEPPAVYRAGDRIDLRFELTRPGSIQVALLDRQGRLGALLPAVEAKAAGPASVGPFLFEGEPGDETFVVVVGREGAPPAEFDEALRRASAAALAAPERRLEAALESIREDGRFAADSITLRHER